MRKGQETTHADNVISNLGIGIWSIEIIEGRAPALHVDEVMAGLLGCSPGLSPEETYRFWSDGLDEHARSLIDDAMENMGDGKVAEVQYYWNAPDGGRRLFRCGGRRDPAFTAGIRMEGSHRDLTNLDHIDDDWRRRSRMLKSYFSYYSSRDALFIILVNPDRDSYVTVKTNLMVETTAPLGEEGVFSDYLRRFAGIFAEGKQAESILRLLDKDYLESYFSKSPMCRIHFQSFRDGQARCFRITLNRQNNNDLVVSLEDRTRKASEDIILSSMSRRFVGGFIFYLNRDMVTVVKSTPFFNFLDDYIDHMSISLGVELLCPHIDPEFRDGWRHFAGAENIRKVYSGHRRADFPFKTEYAGEHIWLRASLYAVDEELSSEPAVALVFRSFSKEEVAQVHQNEVVLQQKLRIEKEFNLVRGIAAQYITLKVIRTDGSIVMNYMDMDPSYGWDRRAYPLFWDACSAMLQDHCHPEDYDRMRPFGDRDFVMSLLAGRRHHSERFRFRKKDGSYVWLSLVLIRFGNDLDTELTEFAFAIANADVEVRREEEYARALEQARRSKDESLLKTKYVNNISHDIRTPLNAVIGYSQLLSLAGDSLSQKERMEYLSYIEGSGEMLTMLVDDILSVSDIENDILRLREETVSCNEICDRAVKCCMIRVPEGVRLHYESEYDDDFRMVTDPRRVQQILINMITNSCKATSSGEILVRCAPGTEAGTVDFEVRDTGCGVSPEKADLIFGRHVTIDHGETQSGHGLGLDICMKLSQMLGGRIWLDRTHAQGARFVLTLPLERPERK